MANTSLPANSAAQHSFFHVITSSNPIKILFEIQFVFATNSISPPLGLQKERKREKTHFWVIGFMEIKNAKTFFPFCLCSFAFHFPLSRFYGRLTIPIFRKFYLAHIDGIACMRACVCVPYSLDLFSLLLSFAGNFTIESVLSDKMANRTICALIARIEEFGLNSTVLSLSCCYSVDVALCRAIIHCMKVMGKIYFIHDELSTAFIMSLTLNKCQNTLMLFNQWSNASNSKSKSKSNIIICTYTHSAKLRCNLCDLVSVSYESISKTSDLLLFKWNERTKQTKKSSAMCQWNVKTQNQMS